MPDIAGLAFYCGVVRIGAWQEAFIHFELAATAPQAIEFSRHRSGPGNGKGLGVFAFEIRLESCVLEGLNHMAHGKFSAGGSWQSAAQLIRGEVVHVALHAHFSF